MPRLIPSDHIDKDQASCPEMFMSISSFTMHISTISQQEASQGSLSQLAAVQAGVEDESH